MNTDLSSSCVNTKFDGCPKTDPDFAERHCLLRRSVRHHLLMTELKTTESLDMPSLRLPFSQQNIQYDDNISSPKPPILNLHTDILWWIFWLNANMEDEAQKKNGIMAIDTLRYTSQVCSGWRQVILSFSSLWAQVINLSRLEDREWREEVLRRTGKSSLSVLWGYSDLAGLSEDVAAKFLDRHWDRIRWLELDFTPSHRMDKFNIAQFWEIFRRPSDVLETFRITFERMDRNPSPILSPSDFVVFNNLAPALRVFFAPNIRFNLDAPWLANIRSLSLNGRISACDVIQAIPHMPLLECLTDETSDAIASTGDALSSLPQITAPSIKQIIISTSLDMGPYMDFLAQINPAAGCYLAYSHTSTALYTETLTLANQVLYNYSRCCDFPSANHISLDLYPHLFNFEAQIPRKGNFRFKLRHYGKLPCDTLEALFAALPLVKFQDARVLALGISPVVFKPSDCKITEFILSLPSVEILIINSETLGFLLNLPADILSLFFPPLHTVEISSFLQGEEWFTIKQFLISRISIGRPVDRLSIPIDLDSYTDLRSLDEITGLTIILQYRDEEYELTCGNGHVEKLLIQPRLRRSVDSSSSEFSFQDE